MTPNPAQKFPTISHPLSRLGSRESLSISGIKSRDGAQSVDWPLGSPSPQPVNPNDRLRAYSVASSYPAGNESQRTTSSRCVTSQAGRKITTDEVLVLLEDKLRSSSLHSVRNLFKSNDPGGDGRVTKEAFCRILWQLCGYLSPRQINHVMRRMNIDKHGYVLFDDLVNFFRRPATHGGAAEPHSPPLKTSQWLKPPHSAPERMGNSQTRSLDNIKHSSGARRTTPRAAPRSDAEVAEQSWEAFRSKAATGELDFQALFPPMVFGDGGYVIPGQLRECFHGLGIPSSDDIVAKIFRKFEGGSPFAIRTKKFFEYLGLDPLGKVPVPGTPGINGRRSETRAESVVEKVAPSPSPRPRPVTSDAAPCKSNEQCAMTTRGASVHSTRPKTSDVITTTRLFDGDVGEFIAKKLEESHAQVQRALETKDPNMSGYISRCDLRDILQILGIHVKATNLEHFLARNGLRREGGVNYRLLLRRLQSRSGRSMLNKVMRNAEHIFHDAEPPPTPADGVSASMLETKMLDIFQREFLALLATFRQCDPSGTGFLTLNEFRSAIEGRYSIKITDDAWQQFTSSSYVRLTKPPSNATQGQKGYVPYNDFLAKYDVMLRPATADADDPWVEEVADLSHLKEHKERYARHMDVDPATHTHRHEPRPLAQLEATLVDVFLYKFHNFKKEYDLIVREDFCRVDKEKFDYILFRCGFVLTPSELSALWLSMPITRPMESLSIPTILQHVMRLYYATLKPGKFSKTSRDSSIVTQVLEKIRVPILSHWNVLKKKLRYLDPMGTSRIAKEDMLQIVRGLRPNITDMELHYLIEMLESRVAGKTNYFRLMEYFTKYHKQKPVSEQGPREPLLSSESYRPQRPGGQFSMPRQHDYRHPTPPKPEFINLRNAPAIPPFKRVTVHPTVTKPYKRKYVEAPAPRTLSKRAEVTSKARTSFDGYRGKIEALERHPPSTVSGDSGVGSSFVAPRVSPKHISSLGRAFRKEDAKDCGRISVDAFRKIVSSYGITFRDSNELYKMLSNYDRKLRDQVSYEKFLRALS